jgi:predicted ATPase
VVGRDDSIRMLTGLVLRQRLTTIVGSGGIGKTTVAYPVAEATHGSFPDGARFIDLAAVTDPLHVSTASAAALGVEVRSGGLSPALVAHLRDKPHAVDVRQLRTRRPGGGGPDRRCA